MSRQYKLINPFPLNKEILKDLTDIKLQQGEIIVTKCDKCRYSYTTIILPDGRIISFTEEEIENYPNFWEEVIIDDTNFKIGDWVIFDPSLCPERLKASSLTEDIWSRKWEFPQQITEIFTSSNRFTPDFNVLRFVSTGPWPTKSNLAILFRKATEAEIPKEDKPNPVIFTTIDGVDMRLGDEYYYWMDDRFNTKEPRKGQVLDTPEWFKRSKFLIFSTKETALEYRRRRVRVLSYHDIDLIISSAYKHEIVTLINERIEEKYKQ